MHKVKVNFLFYAFNCSDLLIDFLQPVRWVAESDFNLKAENKLKLLSAILFFHLFCVL